MKKISHLILVGMFTVISGNAFAYTFKNGSSGPLTLEQNDSGDHLVLISGCSYGASSQGTIDALHALAKWNDPRSSDSIFRAEWAPCWRSMRTGRWSRKHIDYDDSGSGYLSDVDNVRVSERGSISQVVVTNHLDPKVSGHVDRTTNFAKNKIIAFTNFMAPSSLAGEVRCDQKAGLRVREVMIHEFGHGIGFGHTQGSRWGIMQGSNATGVYCDSELNQSIASPHPDDYVGLASLYSSGDAYRDLAALAYENEVDSNGQANISRADPADDPNNLYCPGDTIPDVEFSVANLGNQKLKYTRTFWSSPTTDLFSSDKSVLWWHSNRTKSPGARNGIFQGKKDLYFNNNDLPPVGETWFMVMQIHDVLDANGQSTWEHNIDNNAMVHSVKIRRNPSCP